MYMGIAAVSFGLYFLNVTSGAFGGGVFLGDVKEMLLLAFSAFFFVVAILKKEAQANQSKTD